MTFCLGMIVNEGIVGIADSRLTSGNEVITARKVSVYRQGQGSFFIMGHRTRRGSISRVLWSVPWP